MLPISNLQISTTQLIPRVKKVHLFLTTRQSTTISTPTRAAILSHKASRVPSTPRTRAASNPGILTSAASSVPSATSPKAAATAQTTANAPVRPPRTHRQALSLRTASAATRVLPTTSAPQTRRALPPVRRVPPVLLASCNFH